MQQDDFPRATATTDRPLLQKVRNMPEAARHDLLVALHLHTQHGGSVSSCKLVGAVAVLSQGSCTRLN